MPSTAELRHERRALAAGSIAYFAITAAFASRKLLWFDELFTVYISGQPTTERFVAAMSKGGDLLPPGIHAMTRAAMALFGADHIAYRLPSIVGFWAMLVAVYLCVRRQGTTSAAWTAVLVPLASGAYWYGFEARPYGALSGAAGCALLAWQRSDGRSSRVWLPVLALSTTTCLLLHWHGAIVPGILLLAEACRWWRMRTWHLGVPIAIGTAAVVAAPLAYPFFKHGLEFRGVIGPPDPIMFVAHAYELLLGSLAPFLLGLLLVFAVDHTAHDGRAEDGTPIEEVVAAGLLAALPLLAVALAWVTQSQALPRYAMPGIMGCALLVGFAAQRLRARRAASAAVAMMVVAVGANLTVQKLHLPDREAVVDGRQEFILLRELTEPPVPQTVVVPEGLSFIRLAFYGDEQTRLRLVHPRDPRILGSRALGELASIAPLRVQEPGEIAMDDWIGVYDLGLESPLLATLTRDARLELRGRRAGLDGSAHWVLLEMRRRSGADR